MVIAAVGLSHFLLDGLVYVAGLRVSSAKIHLSWVWGAGITCLELTLETLMAIAGVAIYWSMSGSGRSAVSRYGMTAFVLLVTALTWTQLLLTAPPQPKPLKVSWVVAPIVFSAIAYALDHKRVQYALLGKIEVSKP
jgi:hypothetical protein